MKSKFNTYSTSLISSRRMSPGDFLKERRAGKALEAKFVPPKIGSKGFGKFEVKLSTPHYEVSF